MRKMIVGIMLITMMVAGCGGEQSTGSGGTDEVTVEKTRAAKAEAATSKVAERAEKTTEKEPQVAEGFAGIEAFSQSYEAMYDYFEEITEGNDDMTILGDGIMIGMTAMKLMGPELEYAMRGMPDSWEELDDEMPNGRGVSDSKLFKKGDSYHYEYANKWDTGYEDTIHMVYDPTAMTIDYYDEGTNENNPSDSHLQFYMDDGTLYMTLAEYSGNNKKTEQMVLMYDGTQFNYGRMVIEGEARNELGQDLVEVQPASWEALAAFGTFDTMFVYNGSQLTYTSK